MCYNIACVKIHTLLAYKYDDWLLCNGILDTKLILLLIAKLSPSSSPNWANLALVSLDPANHRTNTNHPHPQPNWESLCQTEPNVPQTWKQAKLG